MVETTTCDGIRKDGEPCEQTLEKTRNGPTLCEDHKNQYPFINSSKERPTNQIYKLDGETVTIEDEYETNRDELKAYKCEYGWFTLTNGNPHSPDKDKLEVGKTYEVVWRGYDTNSLGEQVYDYTLKEI